MPLVVTSLSADIKAALDAVEQSCKAGDTPDATKQMWADKLAAAIDKYIKSGDYVTPPGVAVQVAVPAGTGATIASGTAKAQ